MYVCVSEGSGFVMREREQRDAVLQAWGTGLSQYFLQMCVCLSDGGKPLLYENVCAIVMSVSAKF